MSVAMFSLSVFMTSPFVNGGEVTPCKGCRCDGHHETTYFAAAVVDYFNLIPNQLYMDTEEGGFSKGR
jgi:hypothetical protein